MILAANQQNKLHTSWLVIPKTSKLPVDHHIHSNQLEHRSPIVSKNYNKNRTIPKYNPLRQQMGGWVPVVSANVQEAE